MALYIDNQLDLCAAAGGRELTKMPAHFFVINLQEKDNTDFLSMVFKTYDSSEVKNWIWCNLVGRFCIEQNLVGFEDPAEASMFILIKDTLVEKFEF